MTRYEILSLDVWGNAKDGWELNQWFSTGIYVEVLDTDKPNDVLKKAKKALGITSRCGYVCDVFSEYQINFNLKRNGKPAIYMDRKDK